MVSNPLELFTDHSILPVVTVDKVEDGVPLAQALLDGGIGLMEVTLRSDAALSAVDRITAEVEIFVGLGTVIEADQFRYAHQVGAHFTSSPGLNASLISVASEEKIPYLPGVYTASEVMLARDLECATVKFFPAYTDGRLNHIDQIARAFPAMDFVLTGGIDGANYLAALAQQRVVAVGGSWIAPRELIAARDWAQISERARQVVAALPAGGEAG